MSGDFKSSFYGKDWAVAFVRAVRLNPKIPTDEETMTSWFANAIMRGFDEAQRRAASSRAEERGLGLAYGAGEMTPIEQRLAEIENETLTPYSDGFNFWCSVKVADAVWLLSLVRSLLPHRRGGGVS